jgi:hypothetical protein
MSQLVVDAHIRERLRQVQEAVDLVDETGRKLGRFTPEPFCPWDPALTPEEARRLANEPGRRTLAEIWQRLGAK